MHSLDVLEGYNVDDKTWTQLDKLKIPRSGLGGAFLKVCMYDNYVYMECMLFAVALLSLKELKLFLNSLIDEISLLITNRM